MNRRKRVESVGTMSKPGLFVGPGQDQEVPAAGLGGIRHRGGVNRDQALVWNVGTCRFDGKGKVQVDDQRG